MGALVPCIVVSTLYVVLTCALCEALRKAVEAAVPNGLAKTALLEAIAGAELCGAGFELIISKYQNNLCKNIPLVYGDIHKLR